MVIDLLTDNSQSVMGILCQYVTLFHSLEVMCQLFPFDNGLDLDKYSFATYVLTEFINHHDM